MIHIVRKGKRPFEPYHAAHQPTPSLSLPTPPTSIIENHSKNEAD